MLRHSWRFCFKLFCPAAAEDVDYGDNMFDAEAAGGNDQDVGVGRSVVVEIKKEVDRSVGGENFSDEDEILAHRKTRKRPLARKRKSVEKEVPVKVESLDSDDDDDDGGNLELGAVADSPNAAAGAYPCEHCEEVFASRQGLSVHVKR